MENIISSKMLYQIVFFPLRIYGLITWLNTTRPDVFHSLHCLNAIRNELHPTLYNISNEHNPWFQTHQRIAILVNDPTWMTKHIEHCLDRIRQVVMCHGDLTPSPLYSWPR